MGTKLYVNDPWSSPVPLTHAILTRGKAALAIRIPGGHRGLHPHRPHTAPGGVGMHGGVGMARQHASGSTACNNSPRSPRTPTPPHSVPADLPEAAPDTSVNLHHHENRSNACTHTDVLRKGRTTQTPTSTSASAAERGISRPATAHSIRSLERQKDAEFQVNLKNDLIRANRRAHDKLREHSNNLRLKSANQKYRLTRYLHHHGHDKNCDINDFCEMRELCIPSSRCSSPSRRSRASTAQSIRTGLSHSKTRERSANSYRDNFQARASKSSLLYDHGFLHKAECNLELIGYKLETRVGRECWIDDRGVGGGGGILPPNSTPVPRNHSPVSIGPTPPLSANKHGRFKH